MKKITTAALFLMHTGTAFAQEGRVGINTTNPKTTFDVNGKIDGSGNLLTTDITGLQAPRLTRAELTAKGNTLYGADQKGALVYITDVSGGDANSQRTNISAVGYYYFDGTVWQAVANGASATASEPWYNVATNTGATANTQNIYQMGNVGIGTTAPTAKLDVNGKIISNINSSSETSSISSVNDGGPAYIGARSSGSGDSTVRSEAAGTGTPVIDLFQGTTQVGYLYYYMNKLRLSPGVADEPLLLMKNGGNVGIGTDNPTAKLDVNGKIRGIHLTNGSANVGTDDMGLFNQNSGIYNRYVTNGGHHHFFVDGASGNNFTGGTPVMAINTSGNVGIGTAAPNSSAILDLSATDKAILLPRIANIANITSPVDGMVFYHSVQKCFKGYANGTWLDITTCSPDPAAAIITFNKVNKYNGVSVINSQGIGYNGEAIPASSTIDIEVGVRAATPYSFTATDATTGLTYSASGSFAAAGIYTVVLKNNGVAILWDKYGTINMTLTGASNTLALAPRIDIKSIPTTHTDWTYNNVTYGSQTWMDRNLGARRVAKAIDDVLSYGNHYQWGRPADGHEISVWNGATTTTGRGFADATALGALATSDTPGHPNFILTTATPFDWRSGNNNNRWATANQGPCPVGYHVPTNTEWNTADAWNNDTDAYNSALKLPSAGSRDRITGLLFAQGTRGRYWSSSVSGTSARFLSTAAAGTSDGDRADGLSVRCLKD